VNSGLRPYFTFDLGQSSTLNQFQFVCSLWFAVCGLQFVVCSLWSVVCGLQFVACSCGLQFWFAVLVCGFGLRFWFAVLVCSLKIEPKAGRGLTVPPKPDCGIGGDRPPFHSQSLPNSWPEPGGPSRSGKASSYRNPSRGVAK